MDYELSKLLYETDQMLAESRARGRELAERVRARVAVAHMEKQADPLVRKNYTPSPAAAVEQQHDATMEDWNEWFGKSFNNFIDPFSEELAQEVAKFVVEYVREEVEKATAKLRKEIFDELAVVRCDAAINAAVTKERIINLPQLKLRGSVPRRRSDAA